MDNLKYIIFLLSFLALNVEGNSSYPSRVTRMAGDVTQVHVAVCC